MIYLEEIIRNQEINKGKYTDLARTKAAMRVLHNLSRPVLQKVTILKDGRQGFTNSFILFILDEDLKIKDLPTHDSEVKYPNIEQVVAGATFDKKKSFIGQEMQALTKVKYPTIKMPEFDIVVDDKLLLIFLKIMNIGTFDSFEFEYSDPYKPLMVRKRNSVGVILPIRVR